MTWTSVFRLAGLGIVWAALPSLATAGIDRYECEVRRVRDWAASADGDPWPPELDDSMDIDEQPERIWKSMKRFTVSRESGQIIGGPLDTQGPETVSIKRIDRGSEGNNFQILIQHGRGAALLVIHEWWTGKDKPFVAFDSAGTIHSGVCR